MGICKIAIYLINQLRATAWTMSSKQRTGCPMCSKYTQILQHLKPSSFSWRRIYASLDHGAVARQSTLAIDHVQT